MLCKVVIALVVAGLILPLVTQAQTAEGRITGLVTDPDEGVIPAAEIVARQ